MPLKGNRKAILANRGGKSSSGTNAPEKKLEIVDLAVAIP